MQHIRDGIMVVNTETIAGKVITQNLGVVGGSTVRAQHIGKDIGALFKNIGGGELRAYTELLEESRNEAIARMVADAQARGANAMSTSVSQPALSLLGLQSYSHTAPRYWSSSQVVECDQ